MSEWNLEENRDFFHLALYHWRHRYRLKCKRVVRLQSPADRYGHDWGRHIARRGAGCRLGCHCQSRQNEWLKTTRGLNMKTCSVDGSPAASDSSRRFEKHTDSFAMVIWLRLCNKMLTSVVRVHLRIDPAKRKDLVTCPTIVPLRAS